MPSDDGVLTGRCYCGSSQLKTRAAPQTVAYCHCTDCRRISGAPVTAFAAFSPHVLTWTPALGDGVSHSEGVWRWFCHKCGSPLAARYAYLPEQIYVPVGLFDEADALAPQLHAHAQRKLSWLHLSDDLPKADGSTRDVLNSANTAT